MANKNKPALRFKGFEEEWEEKKLGDLGTILTGNTPSTQDSSNYSDDGILWVTPTDISENITYTSARKLSIVGQTKARVVPKGSILVTCIASIGKNTLLGKKGGFNQQINAIVVNNSFNNSYFLFTHSHNWSSIMKNIAASGTMQIVNKKEFSELLTSVPQLPEQTKIGTYFKNLDALIALQEEKLAKLQNLKKAMLEKMFPAANADVPEIRCKGFSDKWEKKKLGEVCSNTYGGGTPSTLIKEYWDGNIPWIQSSDLSEGEVLNVTIRKRISQKGLNNSATKLVPKKSIAIITRVGVGKLALVPFEFATSQDFLSLSNLNIDILFGVFSIGEILKKELHKVQGTSIKGITKDELLIKNILVPKDKSEQQKIGNYFQNLDQAIAQSGQKITQLKNLKQALLQKMFV